MSFIGAFLGAMLGSSSSDGNVAKTQFTELTKEQYKQIKKYLENIYSYCPADHKKIVDDLVYIKYELDSIESFVAYSKIQALKIK